MFYQIFLSPRVKQCAIITYKHGDLKLAIVRGYFSATSHFLNVLSTSHYVNVSFWVKAFSELAQFFQYFFANYCRLRDQL